MQGAIVAILWDFPFYLALAFGMYVSLRVCRFPDLTVDGSFALGMAGLLYGLNVGSSFLGLLFSVVLGALGGCATGLLYLVRPQPLYKLLAGLLVMFAISSVTYRMMGGDAQGLRAHDHFLNWMFEREMSWHLNPWRPLSWMLMVFGLGCVALILHKFLVSETGRWVRAAGARPLSVQTLGVSEKRTVLVGLAIANAIVAYGGWMKGLMNNHVDVWESGTILHALGALLLGEMVVDALGWGDRSINPKHGLVACCIGAFIYSAAVVSATFLLKSVLGSGNYEAKDQRFVVTFLLFMVILATRFRKSQPQVSEEAGLF